MATTQVPPVKAYEEPAKPQKFDVLVAALLEEFKKYGDDPRFAELVAKAPSHYSFEAASLRTSISNVVHWLNMMNGKVVK